MKKASEYHQHAKECRDLASQATNEEQRQTLLKMADTWAILGNERKAMLAQKQRLDHLINQTASVGIEDRHSPPTTRD